MVGLRNNFPVASCVTRSDGKATVDDVGVEGCRAFKHEPQCDLVEISVDHALQQVWDELELPLPPRRPISLGHAT